MKHFSNALRHWKWKPENKNQQQQQQQQQQTATTTTNSNNKQQQQTTTTTPTVVWGSDSWMLTVEMWRAASSTSLMPGRHPKQLFRAWDTPLATWMMMMMMMMMMIMLGLWLYKIVCFCNNLSDSTYLTHSHFSSGMPSDVCWCMHMLSQRRQSSIESNSATINKDNLTLQKQQQQQR